MITDEDIKKAERLNDGNGFFKSQYPGDTDKSEYSIGYVEELCEYVSCLLDISNDKKLEIVLDLENNIREMLNDNRPMVRGGINYIPTWSKKIIITI